VGCEGSSIDDARWGSDYEVWTGQRQEMVRSKTIHFVESLRVNMTKWLGMVRIVEVPCIFQGVYISAKVEWYLPFNGDLPGQGVREIMI
jgi:hypothetical protein